MSATVGLTRLAYSRVWHCISAKAPHPELSTVKPKVLEAVAAATAASPRRAYTPTMLPPSLTAPTSNATPCDHIPAPDLIRAGVTPPSLGRLASRVAQLLMGKHKPIWDPSTDCGDYVVVTNCAALYTTGLKRYRKVYYRHNTRPGSLKSVTMDEMMAMHGGAEVLRHAVSGMLPKNRLRQKRLARLKAFEGDAHPYKKNIMRFGGKAVGERGWERMAELVRLTDRFRV